MAISKMWLVLNYINNENIESMEQMRLPGNIIQFSSNQLMQLVSLSYSQKSSSFRSSKKTSPKRMDRFRKSLRESFKRHKNRVPEASKPHVWHADEAAVRSATCVFSVKYLGCVEVFESRGMQVCEEAIKVLRVSHNWAGIHLVDLLNVAFFHFRSQDGDLFAVNCM